MFKISREERQKLLNYLKNRPYQEVFTLIALVVGLKPIENSKAKEEKKQHEVAVKKESRSGALTWLIVLGVIALIVALTGL